MTNYDTITNSIWKGMQLVRMECARIRRWGGYSGGAPVNYPTRQQLMISAWIHYR